MWLRASYTVENAVITPLFMLIIIVVMRASCDIHDNLIQRSVNSQFVIQTELGGFNDEDTDMYRIKTEEYLKRRVIFSKKYKIEPEASIALFAEVLIVNEVATVSVTTVSTFAGVAAAV